MVKADTIFGGIEGGGTHSTIVLMNGSGEKLVEASGPSTNHYLCGMEECRRRIKKLVEEALSKADLPASTKLFGLGLCLSGCEDEDLNTRMSEEMKQHFPDLAEHVFVGSDTTGPIATGCPNGGVVIISGTGSNSLLMNPDGKTYRCGGWGHYLGDEGSAYWIARRAVKTLFDEEDNLCDPPHPTQKMKELVYKHFDIKDRFGMLYHCYQNFNKSFYASLTKEIAALAREGEPLCKQIMFDGGQALGKHVAALSRNIDQTLYESPGGLSIICTGSVWQSFDMLRAGFISGLRPHCSKDKPVARCSLLQLKSPSAIGAIYLAARKASFDLPRDYSKNTEVLYRHQDPHCLTRKPETPAAAAAAVTVNGA